MADSIVDAAAVKLMMSYPFWCELYYTMKVIVDRTGRVSTLATDGKRMWVSAEYWDKLTHDYRVTALAHETCHKMLHHPTRFGDRDPYWANIAMDIVVNTMLAKNGFKIHPNWVQPEPKYDGWAYEQVYDAILPKTPPPPPQGGGGGPKPDEDDDEQEQPGGGSGDDDSEGDEDEEESDGGAGDEPDEDDDGQKAPPPAPGKGGKDGKGAGKDAPPEQEGSGFTDRADVPQKYKGAPRDVVKYVGSKEEIDAHEEKVEQQVQEALATAKAMGHAPAGVDVAVAKTAKVAEEKWYDHLHRCFQGMRLSEFDWARVNKRMLVAHGIVAPTQYKPRPRCILVLNDASGSCFYQAVQSQFATHMNAILAETDPEELHVVSFDTKVYDESHEIIQAGEYEVPALRRIGGGGTDFSDLFEWAQRNGIEPDAAVVLTDLEGTFPKVPPPFPVFWASTTSHVAPFGETVHVKP